MDGYLQVLDTVNFGRDDDLKLTQAALADAKAKTTMYMLFYDIVLSPNQIMDSLVVGEEFFESRAALPLPFKCCLDPSVVGHVNPFTKQLLIFLRREGDSAFLFSSVANGARKAIQWGSWVEKNRGISDEDLLQEAQNHYGEVVEWAKLLDRDSENISIQPYNQIHSFETLLKEYTLGQLQYLDYLNVDVPKSRSHGYQAITRNHKSPQGVRRRKQLLDFLSNLQNALGTNSKLIIEPDSPITYEPNRKERLAYLTIDFNGLFASHPEIQSAVVESNSLKLSQALLLAKGEIDIGWESVGKNKRESRRHFTEGLRIFARNMIGRDVAPDSLEIYYGLPDIYRQSGTVGLKASGAFMNRLFRLGSFRGIGKFIKLN